jgi:hypothetical protein
MTNTVQTTMTTMVMPPGNRAHADRDGWPTHKARQRRRARQRHTANRHADRSQAMNSATSRSNRGCGSHDHPGRDVAVDVVAVPFRRRPADRADGPD